MQQAHRVPPGKQGEPSISPDLARALSQTLADCAATGQVQSFLWGTPTGRRGRLIEVRAIAFGTSELILLVHETRVPADEVATVAEGLARADQHDPDRFHLTERQLAVLRLIALGATDKQVAVQLGISTFTASKHVANILAKMQVTCRTEASVIALQNGLITPGPDL